MSRFRTVCCLTILALPAFAFAQAAPPPPPKHEETFEAAYVGVAGNASTNTYGLGAEIIARPDAWVFRHKLSFVRNENAGAVTAQAFEYLGRAAKTVNPKLAFFGEYNFFRDKFAGIVPRNAATGGVSLKVLTTDKQSFAVDAGVGYTNEKRVAGTNISSGAWVVGSGYKVKISPTAELSDDLRFTGIFSQGNNWRAEHAIGLTTTLKAGFSLKVSNIIRYANFPPPGFKKFDSITSIAVVAKFASK
jgi:putative salt-induced outer membrane protein YdiY